MQRSKHKDRRRPRIVGQMVLVGACLILATGTAAAAAPPFGGTMVEHFAMTACPSGVPATVTCAAVTGTGELSHLGRSREAVQATIDLAAFSPATGCAPDRATATFTAANGDRLFMATSGSSCLTGTGTGVDTGRYQITGGTGRFQAASGSGVYTTHAAYAADMRSGTSVTSYTGTITNGRDNGTSESAPRNN